MADTAASRGRLIGVDGSRGKDVDRAADALVERLHGRGVDAVISRWDASGLFGELAQGAGPDHYLSPRTLLLVFAADLAFRVRWEIAPNLEAGRVVIAAPYVSTAIAFGTAFGLEAHWVRNLLRFAPAPSLRGLAREGKARQGWKTRLDRGYPEYCSALTARSSETFKSKPLRKAMIGALTADSGRKVVGLSGKGIANIADAITGTRASAQRPSASRPRSARR